jgi:hypothetical protein
VPITRTFSIYDESGEKAIVTLSGEIVEDAPDDSEINIFSGPGDYVGSFAYLSDLKVREVK